MSNSASGMAGSIRGATESETFDLGGHAPSSISSIIQSAFAEPFSLEEMIRITFVTGAGKLGRQKYDDRAAQTVTSVLRDLEFVEDRGASAVLECAGSFKLQHDTGKNLKTVVVFPKVTVSKQSTDPSGMTTGGQPLFPESSPQHMIATSSMEVFPRMLSSQCPSWTQKKASLKIIVEIQQILGSLEEKLMHGTLMTETEQDFYDTTSNLEQKEKIMKKEMHSCVEVGKLTQKEKIKLIGQVNDKIDLLEKEISNGKEKLKAQFEQARERKQMLEDIKAQGPHALRHEPEIQKLRSEMRPLLKLEQEAKGRLLTLKESTILARTEEIVEEIQQLEMKSRGWFEEDIDFTARVQASRTAAAVKEKKQKNTKGKSKSTKPSTTTSGYKAKSVTGWASTGTRKAVSQKPAKKATTSGGMFAAMMGDSDSD
eukprot:CAMPEP_0197835926 /NCGR_PEP_ID=MMETSP1437-20131217/27418_1 /TAXON_ID=49252 ORGANISM="Eucampia antarctica, Strain CCMP1452" /NCGR_SAMPLE_ID=MMETSP1437 /ASSEMBLY_ACC=CAM_ASM_001096 /LENGTH=426 /DNA_ID=CAMNT_0043441719 /DNA_START=94 /DNA_END=1374 /DNA_ORIENTATION=+